MDSMEVIKNSKRNLTDEELTRMAIEELNREVVKAKVRAEVSQNTWLPPCPLKKANKRFLNNTIQNALNFNRRKSHSTRVKSMKKLVQVDHQKPSTKGSPSPASSNNSHRSRKNDQKPIIIEID